MIERIKIQAETLKFKIIKSEKRLPRMHVEP